MFDIPTKDRDGNGNGNGNSNSKELHFYRDKSPVKGKFNTVSDIYLE
jgi:hypothetical protein